MIESLDESIAAITAKLDELKLTEGTLILFTSDNGGLALNNVTDNRPLRAGKGSAYEGGVRVPLIVAGPGVKAGATCGEPVITMDLFATVAKAAGVELEAKLRKTIDGLPLQPLLSDPAAKLDRAAIYWHYPHYHPGGATPYSAVRADDWRLVHFYEDDRIELYNLKEDAGEQHDLAATNKGRATELKKMLDGWRQRIDAQPPVANPNFDDAKDKAPSKPRRTN
jgi:arylsulfatase A-like enzyme